MPRNSGFRLYYPSGCQQVSENLRPEELKIRLSGLESRLSEIAEAESQPQSVEHGINSPCHATFADDHNFSSPGDKSELKQYGGLFMHLLREEFTQHDDIEVQLRIGASACAIMKITCPNSPLSDHSQELAYIEKFTVFILKLLGEFESIRDKKDPRIAWLEKILNVCFSVDIFVWIGMLSHGSDIFDNIVRTTFLIVKRLPVWCDERSGELTTRRQQLLNMLCELITHRQSMMKTETLIYLLYFLLQPTKEAQPLQHQFACDIIQNEADHLQYNIQMILQRALVYGHIPLDGSVPDLSINGLPPHDVDHSLKRQESDIDLDASAPLPDGPIKDLGERTPYLIYVLHKLRGSIVSPILPSLEMKLRSSVVKERKQVINLLVKLYTETNSTLHATHPELFGSLLARFLDADSTIRQICVSITPRLLKCPDISHEKLCAALCLRSKDPDEDVRIICLKTIGDILTNDEEWLRSLSIPSTVTKTINEDVPDVLSRLDQSSSVDDLLNIAQEAPNSSHSPGSISDSHPYSQPSQHAQKRQSALAMFEVLNQRSRDASLQVRKEAITALAIIYRKSLTQEKSLNKEQEHNHLSTVNSTGVLADRRLLKACLDIVMRLYYQDDYNDKINVERLFKTYFVPYNETAEERMKNLIQMYCLMADSSVKVIQEIFKVQFTVCHHLRQVALRLAAASNSLNGSPLDNYASPKNKKNAIVTSTPTQTAKSGTFSLGERQQQEIFEHIFTLATFLPGSQHPFGSNSTGGGASGLPLSSGMAGGSTGGGQNVRGDKPTENLKRFFHEVGKDRSLQKLLLQLTAPKNTCKKVTEALKEIVRRVVTHHNSHQAAGSASQNAITYSNTVKTLVERAAPVLIDAEAGHELMTQLVFAKESSAATEANDKPKNKSISLERALKLIFAISFYYKDALSPSDAFEYDMGLLSELLDTPAVSSLELKPLTDCVERQQELELCLQILNSILGDTRSSATSSFLSGLPAQQNNLASSQQLASSLLNGLQRHLPLLLTLLTRCCTRKSLVEDVMASVQSPKEQELDDLPSQTTTTRSMKNGKSKPESSSIELDDKVVELLGLLWQHQQRLSKLAMRVFLNLFSLFGEQEESQTPNKEISATNSNSETSMDQSISEDSMKRSSSATLIKEGLVDLIKTCSECEVNSSNFISCLVALGQVALLQPVRFRPQIVQQAKMLLRSVIIEKSSSPDLTTSSDSTDSSKINDTKQSEPAPSTSTETIPTPTNQPSAWTPDGLLSHRIRIKVEGLKFISHWLYGTKSEERERVKLVFNVCCKIIVNDGDVRHTGTYGKELSRIRLAAALCWLKLAQRQDYVDIIEIRWFQAMARTISDPCPEVRTRFLYKLNRGLFRFRLPLEYMAIFSLVPNVAFPVSITTYPLPNESPDTKNTSQVTSAAISEFRQRAKQRLTMNIQRRRDFLQRNPDYMLDPKHLFALLPENILPYAIHLLAHDPRWTNPRDEDKLRKLKSCLSFLLEPLITKGDNFSFIRKLIERMKHSLDALHPEDPTSNWKLYILCDIALALLMTKTTNFVLKDYPVEIRLPRSLFVPASTEFVNQEFSQINEINGMTSTDPSSTLSKPIIQFTPVKKSRAVSDGLLPPNLLKGTGAKGSSLATLETDKRNGNVKQVSHLNGKKTVKSNVRQTKPKAVTKTKSPVSKLVSPTSFKKATPVSRKRPSSSVQRTPISKKPAKTAVKNTPQSGETSDSESSTSDTPVKPPRKSVLVDVNQISSSSASVTPLKNTKPSPKVSRKRSAIDKKETSPKLPVKKARLTTNSNGKGSSTLNSSRSKSRKVAEEDVQENNGVEEKAPKKKKPSVAPKKGSASKKDKKADQSPVSKKTRSEAKQPVSPPPTRSKRQASQKATQNLYHSP